MRIWLGKEMEGRYQGIKTLFIENNSITPESMDQVLKVLSSYSVNRLYFGAGLVNVESVDSNCIELLDSLKKRYMLSIEFDKDGISVPLSYSFDTNVFRTSNEDVRLLDNLEIKLDTGKEVYSQSVDCMYSNNLNDIQDGVYTMVDEVLYDSEKGGE